MSCGGGDSSDTSYEGYWRSLVTDHYLEIASDNTVTYRACAVNDGYRATHSGTITGDNLVFDSVNYQLTLADNSLTISDDANGVLSEYVRASSLPSVCTGDAIELTFISPTITTEGVVTTYMVNFDYRLASTNSGIVYLGFNTFNVTDATLTSSTLEINNAETGSGSLSADVTPVYYDLPDSFFLYINLSENPHPVPWTPLASDLMTVTVNPAVAIPFIGLINQSVQKPSCSNRVLLPCMYE